MRNKTNLISILIGYLLISFFGCSPKSPDYESGLNSISIEELMQHIKVLSSDEFEGRAPSSPGEEKTVSYLKQEFEKAGTLPGNGDSFFQEVPLVESTASPDAVLKVSGGSQSLAFSYGDEFVAWTLQVKEQVEVRDSELVFVGYGIIAPEYDWNDYEGFDVRGKTVLILVNDPGFATEDPGLFTGRAMTYYGRWTYKFEEAARQGAACALLVHETAPAAYGWDVVRSSWMGTKFNLAGEDNNASRCNVEAWISLDTTSRICAASGRDYQALKSVAVSRDFEPVGLDLKADISLHSRIESAPSKNVAALIPGGERADEVIIYSAHWDHFGTKPELEGDKIFNGARDDATGVAALIELAEAYAKLGTSPKRTILFLAVTAEEQSLLGSAYYVSHPIFPLNKTVGVINMDLMNIFGRMKDIPVRGFGQSEMEDLAAEMAAEQDRILVPDPEPEKGHFFRADHFPFVKAGVPAFYAAAGIQHREKGEEWGAQQEADWLRNHYHQPSDEFDPAWDMSGTLEDLQLYFKLGFRLAMESTFPGWKEGSAFKAVREADMRK